MERLYSKRDRTTIGQFAVLIQYMEENLSFAKQKARGNLYEDGVREKWKDLADQLNSRGPPVRDWKTWRKVWNDYKFETRKKIRMSNKYKHTEGQKPPKNFELTENQKRVMNLLMRTPGSSDEAEPIALSPAMSPRAVSYESNSNIAAEYLQMTQQEDHDPFEEACMMENPSRQQRQQVQSVSSTKLLQTVYEHLQLMLEHNAKMQAMEERRLEVEERRLVIEEERLRIEQERWEVEKEMLSKKKASQ
uniref:Regulatory protein zeste n=1 Tax=Nyssomyia neivai TaxID=330878 RepID=A0A1L8DCC4_9DIPT